MATDPTPRQAGSCPPTGRMITLTAGLAVLGVIALLIVTHILSAGVDLKAGFGGNR